MAKARRPPPARNPMHPTLKPDPDRKGSYHRRLDDIKKGLKAVDKSNMPIGGKFLFLYYGCEKLGKGIVGIAPEWAADDAYGEDRSLHLHELKPAAKKSTAANRIMVSPRELSFVSSCPDSMIYWVSRGNRRRPAAG